jgi:N utilization substance protein B
MAVVGVRHAGRELALKMLFQVDLGRIPVSEVLDEFELDEEIGEPPAASIVFAHALVRGTAKHLHEIDPLLAAHTDEWEFERLATADRNILRIAVYEMLYDESVPEEIVINEAVELAKEYSTEESGKFVNGILGNLSRQRAAGTLVLYVPDEEKGQLPEIPETETFESEPVEPPLEVSTAPAKRKRQPLKMTSEA